MGLWQDSGRPQRVAVLQRHRCSADQGVFAGRRYAVEIRGFCAHAEVGELAEVLDVIDGMAGRVHIIDTVTGALLCEGTADEVYSAIVSQSAFNEQEAVTCEQST